jgi:hypothetical protein
MERRMGLDFGQIKGFLAHYSGVAKTDVLGKLGILIFDI